MERDTALADSLREEARELLDETVALRRELHRWPELGNDLPVTREHVLAALEGLPLTVTQHTTTSGLGAVLEGGKPGPTVLLRGDMDALPLHEDTDLDFEIGRAHV
jgi:hippurate hydrolase